MNKENENKTAFYLVSLLTASRGGLAIFFAAFYIMTSHVYLRVWVGLFVLLLIEMTDLFDGMMARRYKVTSELGAAFDPYMDSFSRLIVYWTLAYTNVTFAVVPLVMALRDVTVAYCRIFMASRGQTVSAKWSGKIKAVVQGVAAMVIIGQPVYGPYLDSWIQLRPLAGWVVIIVTLLSIIEYVQSAITIAGTDSTDN